MRTKTLLLTAALTAASTLASMAQVYSVNIVGYINLSIPHGFSMIANQLNASPDNSLTTLFNSPPPADVVEIYKFNTATSTFDFDDWDPGSVAWNSGGTLTLSPGEGAFINNKGAAFTETFVGEVQLNSSLSINPGFQIVSSVIPQGGPLDALTDPPPHVFNFPADNDDIWQLGPAGYIDNNYDPGSAAWGGDNGGSPPNIAVGESFWVQRHSSVANQWARNFSVGP